MRRVLSPPGHLDRHFVLQIRLNSRGHDFSYVFFEKIHRATVRPCPIRIIHSKIGPFRMGHRPREEMLKKFGEFEFTISK